MCKTEGHSIEAFRICRGSLSCAPVGSSFSNFSYLYSYRYLEHMGLPVLLRSAAVRGHGASVAVGRVMCASAVFRQGFSRMFEQLR